MRQHSLFHGSAAAAVRLGPAAVCLLAGAVWLVLMVQGERYAMQALVALSIFGAIAFIGGALLGALPYQARLVAHVDAAAAGAMLAAALVLVIPHAVFEHAGVGVIGLLLGLALGAALSYGAPRNGARSILAALTLHSLFAGIALGALYARIPTLSWMIGVAILAHKAPAGYVLARRLQTSSTDIIFIILPALATGLGALSVALARPATLLPSGIILGCAAGLFAFVALAFVASAAIGRRQNRLGWTAFAIGGATVALVAWIMPHAAA